ncbi:ATP-grasp domain-containing protein [Marinisporobacter balticus]|uniref:SSU ribosomal protein S6P modification protein n=1 Tax=Marinisporobacter balticus TaxID=2018667 RepID=A0A4R2KU36_9FIRM|nr:RimK family alpha-L-glutamate ligase [Marinisporobacter balticus]TCO74619.1 SSU ribosomal protein S6P modification protein [Marinisporobacter balticus]
MIGWIIYNENETEIVSERNEVNRFVEEAKHEGIELRVLKPEQIDLFVTSENRKSILVDGEITQLPDFVLPRMGAGTTYFALAVIRQLERRGVPCINSSQPIENVKDKLYTQQILAQNNFPIPKTMLVKFPVNIDLIEKNIGFPAVVKTLSGTQGKGVFLANNKKSFEHLMQLVEITNAKVNIIIQEFIKDSYGRDLRVLIIGGRAVACMERVAQGDEFRSNFSGGGSVKEYQLTPEIEWLATEACKVTGLEIGGVDLLFEGDHYKICEINSSPGFRGLESCCNINVPKEVFSYIKVRFGIFE